MPQAKKSTATSRSRSRASSTRSRSTSAASRSRSSTTRANAFKEPAALKRLNKALDDAQKALADLGKQGGRDVGTATRSLSKDMRGFITSARRHSGRLGTALKRDFEQAQKQMTKAAKTARASTTTRKSTASRRK
jgi:hypothetical protein